MRQRIKSAVLGIVSVLLWPVAQLLRVARVRFLVGGNVLTRIGHTALAPDVYVKAGVLGWRPRYRGILLVSRGATVNHALLHAWRQHLTIITHPVLVKLLRIFERMPRLQYNLSVVEMPGRNPVGIMPGIYRLQTAWEQLQGGRPLLQLSSADEVRGRKKLQQLRMSDDAWFTCLHVRESGYLPHMPYHSYRNSDITTYLPAVETIVQRGGWVVRMGDPGMTPLPPMKHVIDYVHTNHRSDWMDIFCFAGCRFFFGDTSGPFVVSFAFGVPCVLVNFIPIGVGPFSARDLWIPKRYRAIREDRDLTFAESFRAPLRGLGRTEQYEAAGITWVDNSPEEIQELVVEMLGRLDGRLRYATEDEQLQQRFQLLMATETMPGTSARVGREFLRRHARLLEESVELLRSAKRSEESCSIAD